MSVENVVKKDLKQIYKIERKVFKEDAFTKQILKKLLKYETSFLKLLNPRNNEEIIGFAIYVTEDEKKANIINFVICPEHQNQGWGTFLLNFVLSRIRKEHKSLEKIILNVKVNNEIAIRLYKKFGFNIERKLKDYYRSGENAYLMTYDITSST